VSAAGTKFGLDDLWDDRRSMESMTLICVAALPWFVVLSISPATKRKASGQRVWNTTWSVQWLSLCCVHVQHQTWTIWVFSSSEHVRHPSKVKGFPRYWWIKVSATGTYKWTCHLGVGCPISHRTSVWDPPFLVSRLPTNRSAEPLPLKFSGIQHH
jgi:hypothetical protein